jgi:serine/threonine protein kinase
MGRVEPKRFQREAVCLLQLTSPYVVKALGVAPRRDDKPPLLVLEYAQYGSLAETLRLRPAWFDATEMALVVFGLLKGLEYLHGKANVLHRDVKPSIVLLFGPGVPAKLCDLGMVKRADAGLTTTARKTSCYAAPEVLENVSLARPWSDMWSAGLLL